MAGVAVSAVVILTLLICSWTTDSAPDVTGPRSVPSLKFVVVVCRHGNRGAHRDYALDPNPLNDTRYWPYGKGALTPTGRLQMYELGKKVRSLYNGFLNKTFFPEVMRAVSTATDRSLMSGQMFLAGVYPPRGFQLWVQDILWQPTPLYSSSPDHANVIEKCPKYLKELEKTKAALFKDYAKNVSEVMDFYTERTGSKEPPTFIWSIWDKMISEATEGYIIPEWAKKFFPEPLQSFMKKQYLAYYAGTDTIIRLITGNLVEEITGALKSKMVGQLERRQLQFYSGHDSSIIALMAGLGVPRDSVPLVKPASAFLLELHQEPGTDKHYVQVLYIDGGTRDLDPYPFPLPDCGSPCDVTRLFNYTSPLLGLDYQQECQVPGYEPGSMSLW